MGCSQTGYTIGRGQALKENKIGSVGKYLLLPIAVCLCFQSIAFEAHFLQLIALSKKSRTKKA